MVHPSVGVHMGAPGCTIKYVQHGGPSSAVSAVAPMIIKPICILYRVIVWAGHGGEQFESRTCTSDMKV